MEKLSKTQKDEYATAFAMLALYDGGAEINADQIKALLEATGNTEVEAFYPIIFANYLSDPEKMAKLIAVPGGGGGGGGGGGAGGAGGGEGGAAAEEEAKEDVVEEEEMAAPAMDMFGGGEGGDY